MNTEEIKTTDIWNLYEKLSDFMSRRNIYTDTDKNFRMYNGDQWYGLKVKDSEKIQNNFIKQIVKQKVSNISENNIDVIGIAKSELQVCIEIFFVRGSKMIGREHYFYADLKDMEDKAMAIHNVRKKSGNKISKKRRKITICGNGRNE